MKLTTLLSIVGLLCLTQAIWATTVYETQQTDGTPSFSDQPSPGAHVVKVTPTPIPTNQAPPAPNQTPSNPLAVATPQAVYTNLVVIVPGNEATIYSNSGDVPISVQIQPALRQDDALQIMLDGKVVATQREIRPLTLSGVTRGTHLLFLQIQDGSGQIIKTSPSITFYLHSANK